MPENKFIDALNRFIKSVNEKGEKIYVFENNHTYININSPREWERAEKFIEENYQ